MGLGAVWLLLSVEGGLGGRTSWEGASTLFAEAESAWTEGVEGRATESMEEVLRMAWPMRARIDDLGLGEVIVESK